MLTPPQTMSALMLDYSKLKEKNKNCKKRAFGNGTMMVTALSTQSFIS